MSIILPEVFAGFRNFTAQFEGVVPYLYQDVKGLVTTGIGNLVDPVSLSTALPWQRPDGSPASHEEIVADWQRVKAMPPALVFTHYRSPGALTLTDAAIDDLVASRLDGDAAVLVSFYTAFASFPAPAQTAILSMAWALGAGFPRSWPHFSASVRAQDWKACADNCAINATGNAGIIPRNKANAALFLAAADGAS